MRKHIGIITTLVLTLGVVGCQPAEEKKVAEPAVTASTPELKTTEGKPEMSKPEATMGANKEEVKTPSEPKKETPQGAGKMITTASGLQYEDVVVGKGASPKPGQSVTVHYVGTLTDGTKFDASRDHGGPYSFVLGGLVIDGWNEGVATMKVGGKRKLTVPPALGYRDQPMGPIPPNSTLLFEIELLKFE